MNYCHSVGFLLLLLRVDCSFGNHHTTSTTTVVGGGGFGLSLPHLPKPAKIDGEQFGCSFFPVVNFTLTATALDAAARKLISLFL